MPKWYWAIPFILIASCSANSNPHATTEFSASTSGETQLLGSAQTGAPISTNGVTLTEIPIKRNTSTATGTRANAAATQTSTLLPYAAGSVPWVAFLYEGKIFLADSSGGVMPVINLEEENRLQMETVYMKFSPDKKYLAMVGLTLDEKPVMEVLEIERREIIFQENFEGSYFADFSWAPDSKYLVSSLISQRSNADFDSRLLLTDPWEMEPSAILRDIPQSAAVQVEWPSQDKVVYMDFSCKETLVGKSETYGEYTLGASGIGVIDLNSMGGRSKGLDMSLNGWMIKFVVSPDKRQIMHVRKGRPSYISSTNTLLDLNTLENLPCKFCRFYMDILWFGNYIIGDARGPNDRIIFLADTRTGTYRVFDQTGGFGPEWKVLETDGRIILIERSDNPLWPPPAVGAVDISECFADESDDYFHCSKALWTLEGAHPDSFDARGLPNVNCCTEEQFC